jgi:hypothetical protein
MEPESRRQEYFDKLKAVEEDSGHFLKTSRGATIVTNSQHRSLGVTTLLTNYFKLSEQEKKRIANSKDWGASADVMAWKNTVDPGTLIDGYCKQIAYTKFKDTHDSYVQFDTLFLECGMVPLYHGEMNVGHNTILCPETPGSANVVHPTGAIDMIKYNERTKKLVIVELKTSKTSKNFTTLENAFLKVKHIKQPHFYTVLLKNMFDCALIPFDSKDFELVIVGVHETTMQIALWHIKYMPKYFLGENWGDGRWHSIISSVRRLKSSEATCSGCGGAANYQDRINTHLFWCSKQCRVKNKSS